MVLGTDGTWWPFIFYGHNILDNQYDEYRLIIFWFNHGEDRFAEPVTRSVGAARAQILDEWKDCTQHLYVFMKDKKGCTSFTIYVGRFDV